MANTITTDLYSLVKDISHVITPIEFCQLISGGPTDETLTEVKHLISTRYPVLKNFNSPQKITSIFAVIGTSIDPKLCEKAIRDLDKAEPTIRSSVGADLNGRCRAPLRHKSTLTGRASQEEIQEFFSKYANNQTKKAEELFRLANAMSDGGAPLTDLIPDPFAGPNNLDGAVPRNPVSYDFLVELAATTVLDPIKNMFNREVKLHVPSLFKDMTSDYSSQQPVPGGIEGDEPAMMDDDQWSALIYSKLQADDGATSELVFADGFIDHIAELFDFTSMDSPIADDARYKKILNKFYTNPQVILGNTVTPELKAAYGNLFNIQFPEREIIKPAVSPWSPFSSRLLSSEEVIANQLDMNYGLRTFTRPGQDYTWENMRDYYDLRLVDNISLGSGPRKQSVFAFRNQSPVPGNIISYLSSTGMPTQGIPGPASAFINILKQSWARGIQASPNSWGNPLWFDGSHFTGFFPRVSSNILNLLASGIRRGPALAAPNNNYEVLRSKLLKIIFSSDSKCQPPEQGILDLSLIQEEITKLEQKSVEKDRSKRGVDALCGGYYQLYIKVVAIKIVLESMFVFSRFDAKEVFSSQLFLKYYLKYFIREVRKIDEKFLFRMMDFFRNHITNTPEYSDRDGKATDPLTGEPVKIITSHYVSSYDVDVHTGDSDAAQNPAEMVLGRLPETKLNDVITTFLSEDELGPCDQEPIEIGLGLFADGRTDTDTGLRQIGFFEFFVKKQLSDLIEDIESVFKEDNPKTNEPLYTRVRGDLVDNLLYGPLGNALEIDVAYSSEVSGDNMRFFNNMTTVRTTADEVMNRQSHNYNVERAIYIDQAMDEVYGLERSFLESELFVEKTEQSLIKPGYKSLFNGGFTLERYVRVEDFDRGSDRAQEIRQVTGGRVYLLDRGDEDWKWRDTIGVVNINLWIEYLEELKGRWQMEPETFLPGLFVEADGQLTVNLDRYFKKIKFGYRLNFVYPLKQNKEYKYEVPVMDTVVIQEEGSNNGSELFMDHMLRTTDSDQKLQAQSKHEKAFVLRETVAVGTNLYNEEELQDLATRELTIFSIPLAAREANVASRDLSASVSDVGNWTGLFSRLKELQFTKYTPSLKKQLKLDAAYKTIFEYVFPVDRFLSLLTIYNAEYISGISGREDFLKETQKMIINSCKITENSLRDDWWKNSVDNEEAFGATAVKEEQLPVDKKQIPVWSILKIIQGLIDLVPPLKPWFKIPGTNMGLFEGIPMLLGKVFDTPPISTALSTIKFILPNPLSSLINNILGMLVNMPKSKKLPPIPAEDEDVFSGEEEGEDC